MTLAKIDSVNIALMLLSVALALLLPFELFLISYAVLGPLHYVTEISWLHKKQYFIQSQTDWISLIIICIVAALGFLAIELSFYYKNSTVVQNFLTAQNLNSDDFFAQLSLWPATLVFFSCASAYILTFVKDWFWRINSFAGAIFLALLLQGTPTYVVLFGILITTIIHVWLFTGLFMLAGAVKTKNISTNISLVVFILCSLSFIFIARDGYVLSNKAQEIIGFSGIGLNRALARIFDLSTTQTDLIYSTVGLKIQSFIAFAYTYHYLNWFSKVEIIKWHQVSKKALMICVTIWVVSVAAYAYDYYFGLMLLFFLSMLHVFLEFPLNFRSIAMIAGKK